MFITTVVAADYVMISTTVGPYNNGMRAHCFDVEIIDDPDPERDQSFTISFVPDNSRVTIRPPNVSVTIQDINDCKLAH